MPPDRLERETAALRETADAAAATLRPITDSGVTGVIECDADGRITVANDAFLWLVGHSRDELEAGRLRWSELTAPEHRRRDERALAELAHGELSALFHKDLVRKDGSRVPVLVLGLARLDPAATRWTTTVLPLIERESAAEALRASDTRLAAIIASARDAIVTLDGALRVVVFNEAAEQMFDRPAADVIGRSVRRLVPPDQGDAIVDAIRAAPAVNGHAIDALRRLVGVRASGEAFAIEATVAPADVAGQRLYTVVLRDVDERQKLEEERARLFAREQAAREAAEAASRSKDEFLATLSHELRTPLTAMLTWSHLLRSRPLDPPTREGAIETLERCTLAMARMIDDLLDVSRIVAGKLHVDARRLPLAEVVRGAIDEMRPVADEKGVALACTLDDRVGEVVGDAGRLQQVVSNLLSNAIKFTRRGGRVDVTLAREDGPACITVADTGQGIAPDFLPHVFERFRQGGGGTSARAHGGLGIGLAIVRHLVEVHRGTVGVTSAGRGRGATFTVTLPLAGARTAALAERPRSVDDFDGHLDGVTVLLVEDHDDARRSLATVLEQAGARVVSVESVPAALAAFDEARPDVLLSDIALPGEDGYALVRRIRSGAVRGGRDLPATALTAYAGVDDREQAFAAGFDDHLAKPIAPAALVRSIRTLLDRCARPRDGAPSPDPSERAPGNR